jgi:protein-disulfide isomerase
MPVKKTSTKTPTTTHTETKTATKTSISSRIGPIRKVNINIVYVLGFLLIIASFLIGMLFTKVQYLEQSGNGTINIDDQANNEVAPSAPTGPVDVSNGNLPVLGNEDAKVTLVLFSDFQCPFCKAIVDDALPQIKKDYIDTGKAKLYFRHFPLTSIHPNAQKAAEAGECANEQGNFWAFHDEMFKNQTNWEGLPSDQAIAKFGEYANIVGLNGAQLSECVSSGKMADKVKKDADDGSKVGVNGTPATFINGMMISGAAPFSDFKAEIEKQLNK